MHGRCQYFKLFHRKCGHCLRDYPNERGLKSHWKRHSGRACGRWHKKDKAKKNKALLKERNEKINSQDFQTIKPSLQNMAKSTRRPKGKPLSLEEKEGILRIYDNKKKDLEDLKDPESKVSVRLLPIIVLVQFLVTR